MISEEELVLKRLLTVIPWLSTEWIVSFTVRLTSLASTDQQCNIIHLSQNVGNNEYGDRTPTVLLRGK